MSETQLIPLDNEFVEVQPSDFPEARELNALPIEIYGLISLAITAAFPVAWKLFL